MSPEFDWYYFRQGCIRRVDDLPDDWFRVAYRSKPYALGEVFGPDWDITHMPVHADFVITCYLLTDTSTKRRIVAPFHGDRWYPEDRTPTAITHYRQPHGRVRDRRAALKSAVVNATTAASLSDLISLYAARVNAPNPQAAAYIPALFEEWLNETGLAETEDAPALRMLAGLGGPDQAVALITAHP